MLAAQIVAAAVLPVLGTNLAPLGPEGTAWPFADLALAGPGWTASGPGAQVDAHGALVALAEGAEARMPLFAGAGVGRPYGDYVVEWDGEGSLSVEGAEAVPQGKGKLTFVPEDGDVFLVAKPAGGKVPGSVRVLVPGYVSDSGYRSVFVQRSNVYRAFRFEGWRPTTEPQPFYAKNGVPVAAIGRLLEQTNGVGCVVMAPDAGVDGAAKLAEAWKSAVPPKLSLLVEVPEAGLERAKALLETWLAVFGPARSVLGTVRVDDPAPGRASEVAGKAAAAGYDAVSIPMEFGAATAARSAGKTADEVVADLRAEVKALLARAQAWKDAARRARVELVCYSGGLVLPDPPGADFATRAMLDEVAGLRLNDVYLELLRGWRALGGSTFFHVSDCSPSNAGRRDGALSWIEQDTMASPRRAALTEFALFPDH